MVPASHTHEVDGSRAAPPGLGPVAMFVLHMARRRERTVSG